MYMYIYMYICIHFDDITMLKDIISYLFRTTFVPAGISLIHMCELFGCPVT